MGRITGKPLGRPRRSADVSEVQLFFRCTAEEAARIRVLAEIERVALSVYLRNAILGMLPTKQPTKRAPK